MTDSKQVLSAMGPTTIIIMSKANALLRDARRTWAMNSPDFRHLRLVVSPETLSDLVYEVKHGGTGVGIDQGADLTIWGVRLDTDRKVPDEDVELRAILGRSWA